MSGLASLTDLNEETTLGDVSTSRRKLLRVLFDGMIVTQAIREQSMLVPTKLCWGGCDVICDVAQDIPRTYRGQTRKSTMRELDYLRRVSEFAKSGQIICYSSLEIDFETWGRPRNYSFANGVNPFRDVHFERGRLPCPRSIVLDGLGEDRFEEEKEKFLSAIPNTRFRDLNRATGGHHAADCYHLWTAEFNELDVFLTMEKRFRNAFRGQKTVTSSVQILLPEELCSALARSQSFFRRLWSGLVDCFRQ